MEIINRSESVVLRAHTETVDLFSDCKCKISVKQGPTPLKCLCRNMLAKLL